jgi:hypothetical protein
VINVLTDVFQELALRRADGQAAGDLRDDPSMQSAIVLCSSLKAHKFMDELAERRFERHPVMAPTFDGFLFSERASHGDIKRLEIKLSGLVNLIMTLQSEVQEVRSGPSAERGESLASELRKSEATLVSGEGVTDSRQASIDRAKQSKCLKDSMPGAEIFSSVMQWGFGEGNEGVCVQPTTESAQVLVAGRGIPWWGVVVASLDLRMHSVLLSETRFSALAKRHFGSDVPVGHSVSQSRSDILMTRNALRSCSVVAVESLPKSGSVLSEMWVMSNLKLILVSHGRLTSPPPGWSLSRRNVPHGQVGGVTNCVGHIGICFRCDHEDVKATFESVANGSARPRRDLRSVLKIAIGGDRCGSPNEVNHPERSVGQSVKTVRPGVAMNCGLLEVKTKAGTIRLPGVKTPFGGDMWVIRPLTAGETLGCWDVPERLGLLVDTNDERQSLKEGMFTPLKI